MPPTEQMVSELGACRGVTGVRNVRVHGAVGVVEMEKIADVNALRSRFVEGGVFIRPFGNVIYLTPSFTIAADELSKLTSAIVRVVKS